MARSLYICYFGLREPLVQTQVLPYLFEIIKDGVEISLLTFEPDLTTKWTPAKMEAERQILKEKGISWFHLPYHKRPSVPATLYDIINGAHFIRQLLNREKFDILHCRVHVPMLMAVIARKLVRQKPKLIFDIRGFFPEEYTDAGVWPQNGWLYKTVKRVEKWLLLEADGFVVLTKKARDILFPEIATDEIVNESSTHSRPVEVIPCCVDMKRFQSVSAMARQDVRRKIGIDDRFVIVYAGSFGGWYLSDEMVDFFVTAHALDPSVFVLILTQRNTQAVVENLKTKGLDPHDFDVRSVLPSEMPEYLKAADAGVSFIKNCFSKKASSPTKNAEYLASGLPIIANSGIGDVDELISQDDVGVLIDGFNTVNYEKSLNEIKRLGNIREKCRDSAKARFDLAEVGGFRYRRLYKRLLGY